MKHEELRKHLLIIEDSTGRREFPVTRNICSLGRQPVCDVRLFSRFASRHHATLVRRLRNDGSDFYLIIDGDLNGKRSTNGILVNGRKLEVHELVDGDRVVFGPGVSLIYYLLISSESKYPDLVISDPAAATDEWESGRVGITSDETLHRAF